MKNKMWIVAAAIPTIVGFSGPASAVENPTTTPAQMLGRWNGIAQELSGAPGDPSVVSNFVSAKNCRVQGILQIQVREAGGPCYFPVDVTLYAANVLNGGGTDKDGHRLELHG